MLDDVELSPHKGGMSKPGRKGLREPRNTTLGFRINPDLKARVEAAAVADGRSVGEWAEQAFKLKLGDVKG